MDRPEIRRALVGRGRFDQPDVSKWIIRPGGARRIDMRTAGGVLYPNGGFYLEVMENERLVYTDVAPPNSPAWGGSPPGVGIQS